MHFNKDSIEIPGEDAQCLQLVAPRGSCLLHGRLSDCKRGSELHWSEDVEGQQQAHVQVPAELHWSEDVEGQQQAHLGHLHWSEDAEGQQQAQVPAELHWSEDVERQQEELKEH